MVLIRTIKSIEVIHLAGNPMQVEKLVQRQLDDFKDNLDVAWKMTLHNSISDAKHSWGFEQLEIPKWWNQVCKQAVSTHSEKVKLESPGWGVNLEDLVVVRNLVASVVLLSRAEHQQKIN